MAKGVVRLYERCWTLKTKFFRNRFILEKRVSIVLAREHSFSYPARIMLAAKTCFRSESCLAASERCARLEQFLTRAFSHPHPARAMLAACSVLAVAGVGRSADLSVAAAAGARPDGAVFSWSARLRPGLGTEAPQTLLLPAALPDVYLWNGDRGVSGGCDLKQAPARI